MDKTCCIIVEKKNAKYVKKLLESVALLHKDFRVTKLDNTIALPISFKHVSDNCCADTLPPISCLFTIKYINSNKLLPSKTKTHLQKLHCFVKAHLRDANLSCKTKEKLMLDLPSKWDIHCDLIIFPETSFTCEYWKDTKEEFWKALADVFSVCRVALKSKINNDDYRSPQVTLKVGDNGIVQHIDNGIKYVYDITKNMFSKGNITEKLRISKFDCSNEVVVDLFAGIGYFTLPYLLKAGAKVVYACDWNVEALAFLKHNLHVNKVDGRCVVIQGDNRQVAPKNMADRVNLGLIPTSSSSWQAACEALRDDSGGWLHIHENIETPKSTESERVLNNDLNDADRDLAENHTESNRSLAGKNCNCGDQCIISRAYKKTLSDVKRVEWCSFIYNCSEKLKTFLNKSKCWTIRLDHVEYVKSYAPHVDHLVFDFECRPK